MLVSARGRVEGRASESALRHKVRNLRAKVRLLLPTDACCKDQKRSKNLLKMLQNKSLQQGLQERRWCHRREGTSQLYVPIQSSKSQKHLFHKLTKAQIDQILQDKLYYVGEEFINEFNQFLQERNQQKQKNSRAIPSCTDAELTSKISNLHKTASHIYSEQNAISPKHSQMDWVSQEFQSNRLLKNNLRFGDFIEKRRLISEQEQSRRRILRAKMLEREERYMINYEKSSIVRQHSIKQRNQINEVRTAQSRRAKEMTEEVGEIADISEKLRSLCLQRCIKFR